MTHAPSTYKIPGRLATCPADFRVQLWERGENVEDTIHRSKAVGEPPLMLAISVFHAIKDAVASRRRVQGRFASSNAPATPRRSAARGRCGARSRRGLQ